MTQYRIEKDSMGELKVPANALYQAQTQRAVDNFAISGLTMPVWFIQALAYVKSAAAKTNQELGHLQPHISEAIVDACEKVLTGEYYNQFPVDVFQTGSGTSSNMNMNEVLATLASNSLDENVSPNDHVNMGQSSNDVIPTSIQVSCCIGVYYHLLPAANHLINALTQKSKEVGHICKTGRTHLMDAMPITFAQTLDSWKSQIENAIAGINTSLEQVKSLAQGGTAVGTGINADPQFAGKFASNLSASVGISFKPSENFFYNIGSQDAIVALSGQLKTLAVAIIKIANDLRWMNSGPLSGLGEIELQALQPGSSIMPGKVNPVIPEAAAMVGAQVIGNDATITVAGQSGNLELNVMLPVIAHNVLESINLLTNTCYHLADKAIVTFVVKQENINKSLNKNPILVTALNPVIGYLKAADIAKKAYKENRPIIDVALEETELTQQELENLLNPEKLTQGGIA
ncbi:class II fumarate hydratase [Pseudoalteromonas sp. MMG024]|uniref:class II fumarate hydratase n=1 Tax=Pseudoalteromonas sp. MMG024 TaxID=2909980 RepID=UPI001F2C110D|nr:class II fumarate hydratase [Pseudoalteromonas sp. MMG024]MCF6456677.1 class II fumarate hydratase [Pseudoalteromonas sp. MMG024]